MKAQLYLLMLITLFQFKSQAQTEKVNLYAFVGKKISIEEFHPEKKEGQIIMDNAFKLKYEIIEEVFGHQTIDTIEFVAYDHYGKPPFSKYDFVLLYLSQSKDGSWYHQKYMYDNVYLTKDKKWAGPINNYDYNHPDNTNEKPLLVELKFDKEVSFTLPTKEANEDMTENELNKLINDYFPKERYELKDGKAYLRKGYYLKELFELKKYGVLHARGIF